MAMIVLVSASGSPGVTGSALGLALAWPRPVLLVEADPTGGSGLMAGYFRGASTPPESLIDLAFAHRDGGLVDAIPSVTVGIPDSSVTVLPGTRTHAQARSLTGLWEPLTAALKALESMGQDVIVDAGRLGLAGSPDPLVHGADLALLTVRTDLVALSGARSWAQSLRTDFEERGGLSSLGVLTVGDGRPYRAREVAKVLSVPVTASLAWDPLAAEVFARGAAPPRRFESGALLRSLRCAQDAISVRVTTNRDQLAVQPVGGAS